MSKQDFSRFEKVTISDCRATRETDKAILVEKDDLEVWIPISQIDDDSECFTKDTSGDLIIPRWLATEKGLLEEDE